jgi:hypothetical protein
MLPQPGEVVADRPQAGCLRQIRAAWMRKGLGERADTVGSREVISVWDHTAGRAREHAVARVQ